MSQFPPQPVSPSEFDSSGMMPPGGRPPHGGVKALPLLTIVAWLVICVVTFLMFAMANFFVLPEDPDAAASGDMGIVMMEMEGKYFIGASGISGMGSNQGGSASKSPFFEQSVKSMRKGSVGQRLRFVVLAAELAGTEQAVAELELIEFDLAAAQDARGGDFILDEVALQQLAALKRLYGSGETVDPEVLSDDEQQAIRDGLGWFGELALLPESTADQAAREAVLVSSTVIVSSLVIVFILGCIFAFAGFVFLVVGVVFTCIDRMTYRFATCKTPHGVYAETFAVWLLMFLVMQLVVAAVWALAFKSDDSLTPALIAFFGSLGALVWPMIRGVTWGTLRRDIGWHLKPGGIGEPFVGGLGYLVALPMLGVGVGMTVFLMLVQSQFVGVADEAALFEPAGGPAHPIMLQIADGNIVVWIKVLLVGAVAAPIVEETMFRGVLYQHLRCVTKGGGRLLSALLSGTLSSFIFAAIHPQGWVAIPALMALAYAFVLMREWRGSVVPSMVVHGISNGLVMTLMIIVLNA